MNAPRELSISFNTRVSARTAAKLSQVTCEPVTAGTYPTSARVRLRPIEEIMLDKGLVSESELSNMYSAAIEDGQSIPYHY